MKKAKKLGIYILIVISIVSCSKEAYYSDTGKEYKYRIELSGRMPNAEIESNIVVYTNDKNLTFEKAMKSVYSSNAADFLDIYFESMN